MDQNATERGSVRDVRDGRVFLRDVKPYAIVEDLDQLNGPAGGVVELSHSVRWAPGGPYVDLDEPGSRAGVPSSAGRGNGGGPRTDPQP